MRLPRVMMMVGLACLCTTATAGAEEGLKPGLWEMKVVKQVIDGRDMSAQMSSAMAEMKAAMASMSPEQRAQMEGMMKQHGVAGGGEPGSMRMCMTPEMAKRNALPVDKDGHCTSSSVSRSGNHMSYEFACNSGGTKTSGKGEATMTPTRVEMRTDATMQQDNGRTQTMHSETQMSFVSADCGAVKPMTPPK